MLQGFYEKLKHNWTKKHILKLENVTGYQILYFYNRVCDFSG